jgi:hypothetical protein
MHVRSSNVTCHRLNNVNTREIDPKGSAARSPAETWRARALHADQVWEYLEAVERDRAKQLIRQEATPFLKSQLDRLGDEGMLYKTKRRGGMISRGFLTFGENLGDLEAFARNHPPFLEQSAELQSEILKLAATQD